LAFQLPNKTIMNKKLFFLLILFCNQVFAQWTSTSKPANAISAASDLQRDAKFSSDADGNTYYVWTDNRNNRTELFAQKLNALGVPEWTKDGVRVGLLASILTQEIRFSPKTIKPDGQGGALVVWHYYSDPNNLKSAVVYAQYIDNKGVVKRDGGFVASSTTQYSQDENTETLDISLENKQKINIIFSQRTSAQGTHKIIHKQFDFNDLRELKNSDVLDNTINPKALIDEKNNQLVIYAQQGSNHQVRRINFNTNATSTTTAFSASGETRIDLFRFDDDYNLIIGRTETNGGSQRVFAHKFDITGRSLWGISGHNLGNNVSFDIQIIPLSDGGGMATWIRDVQPIREFRAARFRADGTVAWEKEVVKPVQNLFLPNKLVSDGADGAFTMWFTADNNGNPVFTVQRIDKNGELTLGVNGLAMEGWSAFTDYRLLAHPKGGCIAIFGSSPTNGNLQSFDLFANRITNDGLYGIQNTITIDNTVKRDFSLGETIDVKFATSGDGFLANNQFNLVLLNRQTTIVRTLATDIKTTSSVRIPTDIIASDYFLRVVSTNPRAESNAYQVKIASLPPTPLLAAKQLAVCSGDRVEVTASGCNGTIKWMDNSTVNPITIAITQETEFTATCTIGSVESAKSAPVKVTVVAKPTVTLSNTGPYYVGDEVKLSASGGTTYEWRGPNAFSSTVQNPTIAKATLEMAGTYSVTARNTANNLTCANTATMQVAVNLLLSAEDEVFGVFKVFPNPAKSSISVEFIDSPNQKVLVKIHDLIGREVSVNQFIANGNKQTEKININSLQSGLYLLNINTSKGKLTKHILVE
jgi:hypothetical protein